MSGADLPVTGRDWPRAREGPGLPIGVPRVVLLFGPVDPPWTAADCDVLRGATLNLPRFGGRPPMRVRVLDPHLSPPKVVWGAGIPGGSSVIASVTRLA